jgi:hypothetical protein
MQVWSSAFIDGEFDISTCAVTPFVWRRITAEHEGARLFARIQYGANHIYAALGAPVQDSESGGEKLFLPTWMLDALFVSGMGEEVDVTWMSQEAFPEATRIVLRPHDSAFYNVDAKEELERALTRVGVLRQGDTILISLTALGGFEIAFDVMLTEPANIVLAQGDEVAIEFEGALDRPETPPRPGTPIPFPPEMLVPPSVSSDISGVLLGGAPTRRMADGRAWNPYR